MPQFSAKSRCALDEWRITAFKTHEEGGAGENPSATGHEQETLP